jgi:phage terminase large subunit-like protein
MNLTPVQENYIDNYVKEIISNLPPKAIQELMSGYGNDLDKLLGEMRRQTAIVTHMDRTLDIEKLEYLSAVEQSMDLSLRKQSYNYFKTVCLPTFRQGWRNLEWGNIVQLYPYNGILASRSSGKSHEGCFAFTLWRLYSYDRPSTFLRESVDNRNRKETCIITNNETLGKKHIAMLISEINQNDILREKLNPNMKAKLAATSITTEIDSILHLRSKDSMIRGLHVGAVVCDDLPDESSLYSQEQREKLHEVFYGSITPIVEPFGYLCVFGTPYNSGDLYGDLKSDARFKVFEYPAIFPDGQLLAPDRLTFSRLTEERQSLGTLVFNREYLVVPVADTSTIFPYEFLKRSIHGMEHISFTNDIESYPIKLVRVVVGCDFAISGNVGADYTVYTVWGIDSNNLIYLINLYREQGASHDLQVNRLIEFNARYKPNKLVCESNGFQRILAGMAKERGLINIEEFITTEGNKKDLKLGLPSLSALFESGRLRVPYGDENTRKLVDIMFGEFNSIAFNSKKGTLESVCGHDDTCMSSFMAIQDLRENKMVATIDYIDMD